MKSLLTNEQKAFIRDNYMNESASAMAKRFGVLSGVVLNFMHKEGLKMPKDIRYRLQSEKRTGITNFTRKEDNYIRKHYLTKTIGQLGRDLGRSDTGVSSAIKRLGLTIPPGLLIQRTLESRIKPGSIPLNKGKKQFEYMSAEAIERTAKTRFKKGNIPPNTREKDGEISIRHKTGEPPYKYIRVSLGKWVLLQRYNWEAINGPIPKSHCLWCLGDTLNCDPDNWELITRKENRIRNSGTRNLSDKRVANYLATSSRSVDKELRDLVIHMPDLITAKRTQLLINRKIKQNSKHI